VPWATGCARPSPLARAGVSGIAARLPAIDAERAEPHRLAVPAALGRPRGRGGGGRGRDRLRVRAGPGGRTWCSGSTPRACPSGAGCMRRDDHLCWVGQGRSREAPAAGAGARAGPRRRRAGWVSSVTHVSQTPGASPRGRLTASARTAGSLKVWSGNLPQLDESGSSSCRALDAGAR
jgi:hypothetical protein